MTTILATVVLLGVLIFVHELGHFIAAKLVGIDVERFSIGLGPRVWGFKRGETDYVLSAIPLGGFVKMGGMEDEVMESIEGGGAEEKRTPGPGDFDGKPLWARTLVISAGVIMNMFFAFGAYSWATWGWGLPEVNTNRIGEVRLHLLPEGTEALAEVEPGTRLLRIGDREVNHWGDVRDGFLEAPPGPLEIEVAEPRRTLRIRVPVEAGEREELASALVYWLDPRLGSVIPGSPADEGGLEAGDVLVAVDGTRVESWSALVEEIEARPGGKMELRVTRDGRDLTRMVTANSVERDDPVTGTAVTVGQIGIYPAGEELAHTPVGPVEAVVAGFRETVGATSFILGVLRDLVTGNLSPRSLGSIVAIGEVSGQAAEQGLDTFLRFMALFSINLAILNLLPIPVLDGGHLLFLAIEAVRGKALSVEQRLRWSRVGFFIVVGLMLLALSNDFLRLFGL